MEKKDSLKKFSIKRGLYFWMKGQIFLLLIVAMLLSNYGSWHYEDENGFIMFIFTSEIVIFLFSFIACLRPKESMN